MVCRLVSRAPDTTCRGLLLMVRVSAMEAARGYLVFAVPAGVSAAISAWLTASHPNSEVKQVRAGVVLRWGTTQEGPVLLFLFLLVKPLPPTSR